MIAKLDFPLYQKLVTGGRAIHPNAQFPGGTADYITVHMTGNPSRGAGAASHATWMLLHAEYSWHCTVDDKEAWQSLPWHMQGWHAGDGYYGLGNQESLGLEHCMNQGIDQMQCYENGAQLVAFLRSLGHGRRGIKQHWDWTEKNCPQLIRRDGLWGWYLGRVAHYEKTFRKEDEMTPEQEKLLAKAVADADAHGARLYDLEQAVGAVRLDVPKLDHVPAELFKGAPPTLGADGKQMVDRLGRPLFTLTGRNAIRYMEKADFSLAQSLRNTQREVHKLEGRVDATNERISDLANTVTNHKHKPGDHAHDVEVTVT